MTVKKIERRQQSTQRQIGPVLIKSRNQILERNPSLAEGLKTWAASSRRKPWGLVLAVSPCTGNNLATVQFIIELGGSSKIFMTLEVGPNVSSQAVTSELDAILRLIREKLKLRLRSSEAIAGDYGQRSLI